jgi:hypothetical protein
LVRRELEEQRHDSITLGKAEIQFQYDVDLDFDIPDELPSHLADGDTISG